MKAQKRQEELRNVTRNSQGGKKMRKKRTYVKKKNVNSNIVNIYKNSVSLLDYLLRRNERIVKQDENTTEIPKHPCATCRYYRENRCELLGRPITQPLTTKCFKHSAYPQKEELYLVEKNIEIDTTLVAINTDKLEKHAS